MLLHLHSITRNNSLRLQFRPNIGKPLTATERTNSRPRQISPKHSTTAPAYLEGERTWQKRKHNEVRETAAYDAPPPHDQKHQRIDQPIEQTHNLYPPLPASFARTFEPTGSEHNPLEILSSPEQEPRKTSSNKKTKNFYAVAAGHVPGVYKSWAEAELQVKGYPANKYKGFKTEEQAEAWLEENRHYSAPLHASGHGHTRNFELTQRLQQIAPTYTLLSHARASGEDTHRQWHYMSPSQDSRRGTLTFDEQMQLAHQVAGMPVVNSPPAESIDNNASVDPEPILKPEQQKVVDLILEGRNVFYTGSAGCGKSTILKAFVKQLQLRGKNVKIVAPTNLAALNVGGVTTWSYAGWTPDKMKKPLDKLMQAAHGKEVWERFDKTDVLVIDEISMVENLLFERLNHVMKASRGERYGGGPFGGVQIIVTGDVSRNNRSWLLS
jgi:hypothetical protein